MPVPLPLETNLRLMAFALAAAFGLASLSYAIGGGGPETEVPTRGCIAPPIERHQASIDPGPTLEEMRRTGPVFHTVRAGENLDVIGRRIGRTWEELNELNPHLNYVALERCSGKPAKYRLRPVDEGYFCNEHLRALGAERTDIMGSHTLVPGDQIALR